MKYALIEKHAGDLPVKKACKALSVRSTSYYRWRKAEPGPRERYDAILKTKIRDIFFEHNSIYGARKITEVLRQRGFQCARRHVRRLMDEEGLMSVYRHRSTRTTDSKHGLPLAENLLQRNFSPGAANLVWVSDTTYIPTKEGWRYLCVVIDLYSRMVVGWSFSNRNDRHLVLEAYAMAFKRRRPGKGLIVHTDRGSTYCSHDVQAFLRSHEARASMSRRADPWDNACAEAFFKAYKTEWVYPYEFSNAEDALSRARQYIELFYNRKRIHESLGYSSPFDFERAA